MDQSIATQVILQSVENAIDQEIEKLDNLGGDDLDAIRRKRLQELRAREEEKRNWGSNDHGRLTEINNEKEFFDAAKKSRRIVVLFFRPGSEVCDVMSQHCQRLAENHTETRFIKVNAEKSPFLVQRLKLWMMPTIVLVREQQTEKQYVGLDAFGGVNFETSVLERKLIDDDIIDGTGAKTQTGVRQSRLTNYNDDDLDWD
eukprot:comp12482_c0_seq1/m.7429 comp12482_c0_seq1/g.7429  ORF comp12482_c0_seq1/g.7429 comp12482_c0_seq1/m.7429 type:complete len:201 (-) comp12482_c0_seq1:548-1150(-)